MVNAGIEEKLAATGVRIDAGHVGAFESVAIHAGEGKVVRRRFSAVCFCQDVIDLETNTGAGLGQPAVLAAMVRAPANPFLQFISHAAVPDWPARWRASLALEWRMSKK